MTTVFVLLCNEVYFERAKRTIKDVRTVGNWKGDVVLMTVDYDCDYDYDLLLLLLVLYSHQS